MNTLTTKKTNSCNQKNITLNLWGICLFFAVCFLLGCEEKAKLPAGYIAETNISEDSIVSRVAMFLDKFQPDSAKPLIALLMQKRGKMDGQLYMMRGELFIVDKRLDDARADFQKAVSMAYKKQRANCNIAITYIMEDQTDKGQLYLDSCLLVDPNDRKAVEAVKRIRENISNHE
ncbi:MAG: hypothetical protein U0T74_11430 [Chitinophagales bacterium]